MAAKKKRTRHIPQRTCVICRETSAKRVLTRLVRTPDEGVHVDPTGKRNGRGAYLCDKPACWQAAIKGKGLENALRTTLNEEDRKRLADAVPPSDQEEEGVK